MLALPSDRHGQEVCAGAGLHYRSCMTAEGNITRNLVNEASIYAYRTLVTHLYQDGSRRLDADDVIDILDALMAHCSRW